MTFKEYIKSNTFSYYDNTIMVDNQYITDLYGIEKFTDLVSLDIDYNKISDIEPLKYLKKLEGIYMYKNDITDISCLKNLTNLKYLFIGNNNITDISCLKNLNIIELSLNNNKIADIEPIYYMNKIKKLWITKEYVKNISLDDIELEYFYDEDIDNLKNMIKYSRRKRFIEKI